ncbi:MAG TPA: octaprenyl diphosphate synthase [Steroidobacteraceae bacterium]|nr:octaprenyl diphosphate synthase [Steroidobacteraceae bacterium]
MQLEEIRALVTEDLKSVDQTIVDRLASDVVLVNQISRYIVGGGGKRLRPLSVVLAARACGHTGHQHVAAATIIEFIHTSTLLHDDVVDGSDKRRGRDTANHVFGNQASVLVGDYLYSRSFQMMVELGDMRIQDVMADATNTIAEGEVLQLMNVHDPDTSEQRYFEVVYRKTAKLFEAGAQVAAILSGAPRAVEDAMVAYGRHLGTAFQLVDDVLDYTASADELGKNLGDDLAEGKPTLPVIHTLAHASAEDAARLRNAIEHGGLDDLGEITRLIQASGGLEYTTRVAREQKDAAVAALGSVPASKYRDALAALAEFAVARTY